MPVLGQSGRPPQCQATESADADPVGLGAEGKTSQTHRSRGSARRSDPAVARPTRCCPVAAPLAGPERGKEPSCKPSAPTTRQCSLRCKCPSLVALGGKARKIAGPHSLLQARAQGLLDCINNSRPSGSLAGKGTRPPGLREPFDDFDPSGAIDTAPQLLEQRRPRGPQTARR